MIGYAAVVGTIVETLRKPSTGLKTRVDADGIGTPQVETLRKSRGGCGRIVPSRRDTQKTQHGIENASDSAGFVVETLRKPSTGLKRNGSVRVGRDTQKTQHGIETRSSLLRSRGTLKSSRHSENPARD